MFGGRLRGRLPGRFGRRFSYDEGLEEGCEKSLEEGYEEGCEEGLEEGLVTTNVWRKVANSYAVCCHWLLNHAKHQYVSSLKCYRRHVTCKSSRCVTIVLRLV